MNNKEICPQCLGSKEIVKKKKGKFNAQACTYCELDKNGIPTGFIPSSDEEKDYRDLIY